MRWMLLSGILIVNACGGAPKSAEAPDAPPPGSASASEVTDDGAGPATDPAESDTAALDVKPPKKGTSALEARSIKMDFELTLQRGENPAGLQSGTWGVEEQRSMQVREVGKNGIAALSIVFGKRIAQPLLGIEKKPVTAGNKYLVTAAPGGAAVTTLDGSKVVAEQRDAVLSEFGYVGAPSLLLKIVAAKPARGEKVKLTTRQALALLGEVPGLDIDKTEVTLQFDGLRETGRKTAAFTASVRSEIVSGATRFGFAMQGPALIDVETGWVSSVQFKGAITPTGQVKTKKGLFDVRGKGTIEISRSTTF
ncbi:MAG TPA: hypothetical protein PKA88_04645 [Polyangiaceae bacterium]|nr:hypothetical protein [Polyangiaceae bacterium]